jgi:hypothetical protein
MAELHEKLVDGKHLSSQRNVVRSVNRNSSKVNFDNIARNELHPQLQKKTLENVYRVNKSSSFKKMLEARLHCQ